MDKDSQNISKSVNCSLKLIRQAADERWVKPLALFHLIKSAYGNSVIFDYRHRMPELSKRFGISLQTFYNYLDKLRSHKLIFIFEGNSDNLSLKSIRKIKHDLGDKRKTQITILGFDTLWQVECRLYAKLVENHFKKMAFNEAIRRYGTHNKREMGLGENEFHPSFSVRNVAKLLNINEKTAQKVIHSLVSLGIIEAQKPKARKISNDKLPINLLNDFPGYLFVTERGTFQIFGNAISLLEYPVKIPKITPKIYLKHYKADYR